MQLTLEGKTIDQVAIERLQEFEPPEGYYLAFSGGKDSVVIYDLAMRSGVKFDAHYNVSPIDPPELRQFIKDSYPDVAWDFHARGFWKLVLTNGLPMRPPVGHRWCCKHIKEAGGAGRVKLLGMRRNESNTRRDYPIYKTFCALDHTDWLLPIVDWSNNDVWQYIKENGLPYCSLYDEGFTRLGCILCPFKSARQTQQEIQRWPKIARNWKDASTRYFYKRIERGTPLTQKTPDEFWEWWISRK